jgi:hypothetical protein
VELDPSIKTGYLSLNAVDALIVIVVVSTLFAAYLRFSEPFRAGSAGSGATSETLLVELCMPSGSEWMIRESFEGYQDTDPRSGLRDVRLLSAYRDSDSLTRIKAKLMVRHDPDGTVNFRGRPLILGTNMKLNTPKLIVEGLLCRIGSGDEAQ